MVIRIPQWVPLRCSVLRYEDPRGTLQSALATAMVAKMADVFTAFIQWHGQLWRLTPMSKAPPRWLMAERTKEGLPVRDTRLAAGVNLLDRIEREATHAHLNARGAPRMVFSVG